MSNVLLNQETHGKQKFSQPHPPSIVLLCWLLHFQGTGFLAKAWALECFKDIQDS